MLTAKDRIALLMHESVTRPQGKMGFGLMRYGICPVAAVIDRSCAGRSLRELTGIPCDAPIVASLREALAFSPTALVPAIAPPGGVLPDAWWPEILEAVECGMSLVNGLHTRLADHPDLVPLLRPGQWIWDVRKEPPGLVTAAGQARLLAARRVLFVGTDMANGKMTAAIEVHRAALASGRRSHFLATGQIGIVISGEGVALDAVRVDFAAGAVEQEVVRQAQGRELICIEGQGSLLHPASTATLALMRGSMPTAMILVHRAGQEALARIPWVRIPPLKDVVRLYEDVAEAVGALPTARVRAVALNTAGLTEREARRAADEVEKTLGLPVSDPVRHGADRLLKAVMA